MAFDSTVDVQSLQLFPVLLCPPVHIKSKAVASPKFASVSNIVLEVKMVVTAVNQSVAKLVFVLPTFMVLAVENS